MEILSWVKILQEIEKIKIKDAIAWVKKYLIAASVEFRDSLISIRGTILIKLISKPNHAVNHEFAETAINVPEIKVIKNNIW